MSLPQGSDIQCETALWEMILCNLFHDVTFLKVSYLPLTQKTLESVLALNYYVYYFNTNIICYTVCTSSFSGIMMA